MASTTKLVPPAKSRRVSGVGIETTGLRENTRKFVELETESDSEEEQLIADRDQERYGQVVVVKDVDCVVRHLDGFRGLSAQKYTRFVDGMKLRH